MFRVFGGTFEKHLNSSPRAGITIREFKRVPFVLGNPHMGSIYIPYLGSRFQNVFGDYSEQSLYDFRFRMV